MLITTDGFTVQPLEFPGGNIGSLAVHGTTNDLAVAGAIPKYLSLNAFIEEGLEVTVQNRIFLGEHTEYLVRHADLGNISVLAPRQSEIGASGFDVGAKAHVHWDEDAALILKDE